MKGVISKIAGRLAAWAMSVCMLLSMLPLQGCDYKDLNNILFVTCILIDFDKAQQEPIFYFEGFIAVRTAESGSATEERIVYRVPADTVAEAITALANMTSNTVSYTHCKVILYSVEMAEHGFKHYFDIFDRRQQFIIRVYLGIYDGEAEDFVTIENKEEKFMGIFLYNLINNTQSISSNGVKVDIKEFTNQVNLGDRANSMPMICIEEEGEELRVRVKGTALIKDYTMIGELTGDHPLYFNMLLKNAISGTLIAENPDNPGTDCALRILNYKTESEIRLEGDQIIVKRTIRINTSFMESQEDILLTNEVMDKLSENAAEVVERHCLDIFEEYKMRGEDVFDITEEFLRKYPHESAENLMERTTMEVEAVINIEGTSTTKGYE